MSPDQEPEEPPARRPRTGREKLVLAGKSAGALITFAVTVGAFWIALVDRTPGPTIDEWRLKANNICQRDVGDMQTSLHSAMLQMAQAVRAMPPAGTRSPELASVVTSMDEVASAFRAMSADFAEIPVPEGYDRRDIDGLLRDTRNFAATFTTIATFLVNHQVGQSTPLQIQATMTAMQALASTTMPSWTAGARRLGLTECLAVMGTAPPTPIAPAPAGFTVGQQALVDRVDSRVLAGCVPAPAQENDKVIAAVNCAVVRPGPARNPLVMRFIDAKALKAWLAGLSAGLGSRGCANGDSSGPWNHEGTATGTLVCKPGANGSYLAAWTFDGEDVAVVAEAGDRQTIWTWWKDNAYLLTP
ncbi:hypothetical protein F5972_05140 [Microbispora cellulosiformans]|uniref:Uncharacterized protein n=1 Tax=Microbispora cellulosiformans TaxID=2614688 RepID=A0A5J5K924_9ACTN|nr:hypothetical protein [Microbispora cellulosiformans]KAA9380527.1 hypothetical protein F5972_05140 [Microbispora cellulosiformans]